jgi:hypothetical protein
VRDGELDQLLKSVPLPERSGDYWRDFPGSVTAALGRRPALADIPDATRGRNLKPLFAAWGFGIATACVVLGLAINAWRGRDAGLNASQVAQAGKFYREVEALFPNQIQAIVFEPQGPRLVLAARADVPSSQPYYLKVCSPQGCERIITFSGQQVRLSDRNFEVLADAKGGVMLVGADRVWTGGNPNDAVQIHARSLSTAL